MVLRVGSVSKPRLLYVFMISFIPWNLRYHNLDIIWTGLNQCVFLLSSAFPPTFSCNAQNPYDFPSEVRLRLKVKSIVLLCEQPWIAQRTSIRKSTGFCLCVLGIVVFSLVFCNRRSGLAKNASFERFIRMAQIEISVNMAVYWSELY